MTNFWKSSRDEKKPEIIRRLKPSESHSEEIFEKSEMNLNLNEELGVFNFEGQSVIEECLKYTGRQDLPQATVV